MDFLAPRQSVLQSSRSIDLRSHLGHLLAPPLSGICSEVASLLRAVRAKRYEIAGCITQVLFGLPNKEENKQSDMFSSAWDTLFGCPVDLAPHAIFTCYRVMDQEIEFEVAGLQEPPKEPQAVPKVGSSYGDAWLSALHMHAEPGTNEMRTTAAIGSHADLVPMVLDLLSGVVSSLAFVSSGCSDTHGLCHAYRTSFPHLSTHFARFVNFGGTAISVERMTALASRFTFEFPLDYIAIEQHYERIVELLQHFERLSVRAIHPDTGALLAEVLLENDVLRINVIVQDGSLCWEGDPCVPISWSSQDMMNFDIDIDSDVRLLGLSFPSLPFPHLRLKCQLERDKSRGHSLLLTCTEVGEVVLESLASFVFDVPRFRQLALDRFRLEIAHRCADEKGGHWIVTKFVRLPFPVAGLAQMFAQYFRQFVTRQMQEMQLLEALQDFFIALGRDAAALSSCDNERGNQSVS